MINMLRTLGMLALLPTLLLPLTAVAELRIFACEPEWSALAEELGGDLVEASSATHALQDPHYVQARPSLISKVRKADLVICRSGALTVAEIAAAGVASVLVPFAYAVDDHQTRNAEYLADAGAAVILAQSTLESKILADALKPLLSDREVLLTMATAARSKALPDAAEKVVEACQECMSS